MNFQVQFKYDDKHKPLINMNSPKAQIYVEAHSLVHTTC